MFESILFQIHTLDCILVKITVCTIYTKAFAKNCQLMIYQRGHIDKKPYVCTICTNAFGYTNNCVRQIRLHTASKS